MVEKNENGTRLCGVQTGHDEKSAMNVRSESQIALSTAADNREIVLRITSAAAFLIIFQAYLVAPLLPTLSLQFHVSIDFLGFLIPAYMLPYGLSTLICGPLSDRFGRKPVILTLLGLMILTIAGISTSQSANQMMAWRVLGGLSTGGIIPISLALLGDLFPYEQRGRAIGWIFGAIAGGMAFGSSAGAMLNPILGWRLEFLFTAGLTVMVLIQALRFHHCLEGNAVPHPLSVRQVFSGYLSLYANPRGARAYVYILLNGMFHSGVFSWLGLYYAQRYHLGDSGIGLALLGYGIPGMLLGPFIGRLVDRIGRKWIIPLGFLVASLACAAYIPHWPLLWPAIMSTVLSLGYDMSHPLLAGIITSVNPARRGLAMGMNAFVLFSGLGLGPLVFQFLLKDGFTTALGIFALVQLSLALLALPLFRHENTSAGDHSGVRAHGKSAS